ncbi:fetal and adult testis-expressed transcript protein isoform X2 [Callithrix jacchus]|uniref:fetal and adult testis-expressed transcript protein isoform X2 n=1 Tax=Callithrix jacchus TaxID=9483 RepID=UPI0004F096BF|nr:fetal and adult testis-expressed transcript protein isoform X2 [Callithrix jacchus]
MMAGGPISTREEVEISLAEELNHGSQGQNQEHLGIAVMDHRSRSLSVPQKRQKVESKAAGSAEAKPVWNMTATRPKKMGTQLPMPRMLRESGHGEARFQECPGSFQGIRNPETGTVAETGLEGFNGLEMEIIKRQLCGVSGRLRALEEQDATWRQKETLIFALLLSASIANLWLWMHQ